MLRLTNLAQRAIVAHRVIESIRGQKFPTNVQILSMPKHKLNQLNNSIRPLGERLLIKSLAAEPFLEKHNSDSVLNIFKYGHGLPLSSIISKHKNIEEGSNTFIPNPSVKSLVFFPTSTTTKLFKFILENDQKSLIYGIEGIGKSISTLLFWHLSSIISEFRVKENHSAIQSYVNMELFTKTPKIIYYQMKIDQNLTDLAFLLHQQSLQLEYPSQQFINFKKLMKNEQKKEQKKQICQSFIKKLSSFMREQYTKRGIRMRLVVDSADRYFYLIQSLVQSIKTNQQKQHQLALHFNQVEFLQTCFPQVIFITNKQIPTNLEQLWSTIEEKQLCKQKLFFDEKCKIKNLHSKYRLTQQFQQIETDLILWFQIVKKLLSEDAALSEVKIRELYNIYKIKTKYVRNWQDNISIREETWATYDTHQSIQYYIRYFQFQQLLQQMNEKKTNGKIDENQYHKQFFNSCKQDHHSITKIMWRLHMNNQRVPLDKQKFYDVLRIIQRLSRQELLLANYQYSNRFKMKKYKIPEEILTSKQFQQFIDYGIISVQNDQYYFNHTPSYAYSTTQFMLNIQRRLGFG